MNIDLVYICIYIHSYTVALRLRDVLSSDFFFGMEGVVGWEWSGVWRCCGLGGMEVHDARW